jgi:phosphatidylserine synthase
MSHDDRIYVLIVTWVSVVAAVVYAILVISRWRQRPWTGLTRRAMVAAVMLPVLAVWLTILHLN